MSQQSLSVVGCCILELLSSSTTLSYSRPCSRHGPRDSVAHPQTTNDDADSTEAPQDPQGGALGARKVSLRRVHPSSSASHVDRRERFELLQTIQCCYDSGSNQLLAAYRINRPHSPPEAFVRSPTASRMTLITEDSMVEEKPSPTKYIRWSNPFVYCSLGYSTSSGGALCLSQAGSTSHDTWTSVPREQLDHRPTS